MLTEAIQGFFMRRWVMAPVSTLRSVVPSSTLASFWMSSALTWSVATASMESILKVEVLLRTRRATPRTAATMATMTPTRRAMPRASAVRTWRARASLASRPLWGLGARCGRRPDGLAWLALGVATVLAGLGFGAALGLRCNVGAGLGARAGREARLRGAEAGREGRAERPCVGRFVAFLDVGLLLSSDAIRALPMPQTRAARPRAEGRSGTSPARHRGRAA